MKQQNYRHTAIRFRRLTRKAYAIFLSLHREVTIGNIAGFITDLQLKKSFKNNELALFSFNQENDDDLQNEEDSSLLQNVVLTTIVVNSCDVYVPAFANSIDKNIHMKSCLNKFKQDFFYTIQYNHL